MFFRPQGQITSQMPKFELKPVDGGNIVHLPEGETVFGRGALFGVNDKRVSRHHGVLENADGVLRIKPTHLNPCFIQSSLEADPQPLKRDQWHTLGPGELFSLLPGKYIYRVEASEETVETVTEAKDEDEDEGTLRNSQNLDVENRSQRRGEEVVPEEAETSCSAPPSANEEPEQSTSSGREGPWASQQSTLVASLANRSSVEFPPSPTEDLGVDGGGGTSAPQQRKRTLPAWMMTAAAGEVKTPSTPKGAGKRGPAKGAATTTTPKPKPKAANQATATATPIRAAPKRARTRVLSSEEEDEDVSAAEVPEEEEEEEEKEVVQVAKRRRKRRKSSEEDDEAEEETEAAAPPARDVKPPRRAAPALDEMSEESDSMEVEQAMDKNKVDEEEEKQQVEVKRRTGRTPGASSSSSIISGDAEGSDGSKRNGSKPSPQNGHRAPQVASEAKSTAVAAASAGASGGSGRKTTTRTACPYGSSCYRKNPIHFQECSHPGDSDYEEEAEEEVDEEDDDRPECPYGTDCYRTNPLHKKEYKHTRPPARTSARASRRDRDDKEEDEDAYDDSFINDDSEEDVDGDSDYVPDDSGDSGKEDVKRLQNEAKAFLQRKK